MLQQVQDADWALQQCLSLVAASQDQQTALFQYGLELTSQHCSAYRADAAESGGLEYAKLGSHVE